MKRPYLFPLAVLLACGPANTPVPPAAGPSPSHEAKPMKPTEDPHAKAVEEVARLRKLAAEDPLLAPWGGAYGGVPPWDKAQAAGFPKAFEVGLALLLAEVEVIATDPAPPTFDNTIRALEDAGRHAGRAENLFSVFTGNLATKDVQEIDREWSPKQAAAYDKITFHVGLFARIAAVHAQRAALPPDQKRLVELVHEQHVRAGARLDAAQKKRLGEINQELAVAFADFGNKVLADEDTWIVLETKDDLAGLPASLVDSLAAAAKERGLTGKWAVVNTRSSVDPFLQSSKRRDLREKVWKAFKKRGDNGDKNDTNATIVRIVRLRAERAKLLGYASHAHWRMSDTMAIDPKKADELMKKVWVGAAGRVKEEVADMAVLAKKDKVAAIEPWDYLHYAEKVRKQKYALDQTEIEPYFELGNMIAAAFYMAEQLYGISFVEITGKVPTFRPDVRVWEVKDKATGAYVGLFYGDYFARAHKRSGAWASTLKGHESFTGKVVTPIVSNNNNFVAAPAGQPTLISMDDAQTLFHEFGHALHGLLSEVVWPGLASTPRDFVEYPSQVHEMWVLTRPILDRFAKHAKTGKAMPQALVTKILAAGRFNQGYATTEYLTAAIVDMELHSKAWGPDDKLDPGAFERDTLKALGAPKEVALRHRLPQFNHLFTSDAYSAGYYSYLWSEVMDADTRQAFAEAGDVFHKPTADKLRKYILAPGNSTDRAEAYRLFRGRDPDVKALLEKRGFPTK